jgi:hypothetical protein
MPEKFKTEGIQNSDLHIIISFFNQSTGELANTFAQSSHCLLGPN